MFAVEVCKLVAPLLYARGCSLLPAALRINCVSALPCAIPRWTTARCLGACRAPLIEDSMHGIGTAYVGWPTRQWVVQIQLAASERTDAVPKGELQLLQIRVR